MEFAGLERKEKRKKVPRSRVRFVREGGQVCGAQQLGKQLANTNKH